MIRIRLTPHSLMCMTTTLLFTTITCVSNALAQAGTGFTSSQIQELDLRALAALPLPFESRSFDDIYDAKLNESASQNAGEDEPHFQVIHQRLASKILGDQPSLRVLHFEEGYAFAHEAPVYFPDTDTLYFSSDAGGPMGRSDIHTNNVLWQTRVGDLISASIKGNTSLKHDIQEVAVNSSSVQMTNGGTPYGSQLLVSTEGRGDLPGTLALIDTKDAKREPKLLLNNAAGKQFNAPNDVVVHPNGAIFFTDADYAQTQNFRPKSELPKMTWSFDPVSGRLRPLDVSITTPNGLVLSPDSTKLYITDTAPTIGGNHTNQPERAASVFVFDVYTSKDEPREHWLGARRLFAWSETGVADGIKVDTDGNVYAGTGDGVQIWNSEGISIAKIYIPNDGAVNLVFAGKGRLIVTAQERLFLVQLAEHVEGPSLTERPSVDARIQF